MKATQKTLGPFVGFLYLAALAGTVAWAVLERILGEVGVALDLSFGPAHIDLVIIGFSVFVNPGTLLGLAAGFLWLRRI